MKTRHGFVSNSSSSSFIVNKQKITPEQLYGLRNYTDIAKELKMDPPYGKLKDYLDEVEGWQMRESKRYVNFFTTMDNFDMQHLFDHLGISEEAVERQDDGDF